MSGHGHIFTSIQNLGEERTASNATEGVDRPIPSVLVTEA